MANTVNLLRNTKVYFTTLSKTAFMADSKSVNLGNTWELQVLSDFTFSQGTEQQTITLNEAGATPVRGQRSFNTAINPVDWSFGTYIRPYLTVPYELSGALPTPATNTSTAAVQVGTTEVYTITTGSALDAAFEVGTPVSWTNGTAGGGFIQDITEPARTTYKVAVSYGSAPPATGTISQALYTTAPEALLWNALASNKAIGTTGAAWTQGGDEEFSAVTFENSDTHRFQSFGLVFKVDNTLYYVSDCAVNQADINFGIDQIAQVAWSGQGTDLTKVANDVGGVVGTDPDVYFTVGGTGSLDVISLAAKNTWTETAGFIANKLSLVGLKGFNVNGVSEQEYDFALTGGQLTINNNITFLTPEVLGAVNKPIGYFSGTRAISGNFTAYLKVATSGGQKYASELLSDLVNHSLSDPDNLFKLIISMGGAGLAANQVVPYVQFTVPTAMLQIPTVDVQDVVSATVNFTAQGSTLAYGDGATTTTSNFDILKANELYVHYKTKNVAITAFDNDFTA